MNKSMPIQVVSFLQYYSAILFFKNGALAFIGGIFATISFYTIRWELIIGNADRLRLLIPLFIEGFCVITFIILTSVDLITGIRASRATNSRRVRKIKVVQSHRLYKTVWKFVAVVVVTFMLCFIAGVCELLHSIVYDLFIWSLIWIWFLIIGFEWKSIGENLERIDGKKLPIFMFMNRLLNVVENKGINKISNVIAGPEELIKDSDEESDNSKTLE